MDMSGPAPRDGIVVGVDGPPASEVATAPASDEASRRGAELVEVYVWSDVAAIPDAADPPAPSRSTSP